MGFLWGLSRFLHCRGGGEVVSEFRLFVTSFVFGSLTVTLSWRSSSNSFAVNYCASS